MPYSSREDFTPALRGIQPPITVAQANQIARWADAMTDAENPWAAAIAQFKRLYKPSDGGWAKIAKQADVVFKIGNQDVPYTELEYAWLEKQGRLATIDTDPPEQTGEEMTWTAQIVKAEQDKDKRLIYGVVLRPNVPDSQGDLYDEEEVRKAAHSYLVKSRQFDYHHQRDMKPDEIEVVESALLPFGGELNGTELHEGDWYVVAHVVDKDLWEKQVKTGEVNAYSIRGWGTRTPAV